MQGVPHPAPSNGRNARQHPLHIRTRIVPLMHSPQRTWHNYLSCRQVVSRDIDLPYEQAPSALLFLCSPRSSFPLTQIGKSNTIGGMIGTPISETACEIPATANFTVGRYEVRRCSHMPGASSDLKIGSFDYTRVVNAQTFQGLCELLGNEPARLASP